MSELLFVFVFIVWYVLALIVSEKYGKNAKSNVEWLFFLSMMFSPVIGIVIAKLNYSKETDF